MQPSQHPCVYTVPMAVVERVSDVHESTSDFPIAEPVIERIHAVDALPLLRVITSQPGHVDDFPIATSVNTRNDGAAYGSQNPFTAFLRIS